MLAYMLNERSFSHFHFSFFFKQTARSRLIFFVFSLGEIFQILLKNLLLPETCQGSM